MQFVHQALTWGFLIALVPLLIHLINLVRRQRVQWAAMDFLLQSYRKHRTWIWLKQLVLLLMRMAAVAVVVAMLAQWVTQKQWFNLFGAAVTHHYVLLDDSYSMSERVGGSTSFDRAERALAQLASEAMAQESFQKFTLLRYSRAATVSDPTSADLSQIADFNAVVVDGQFDVQVEEARRTIAVTELATGPRAALAALNQLLEQTSDENNVVYLLSDFRDREWENPGELRSLLREASDAGAELQFVNCAQDRQPNLSLVEVKPDEGTRAAGVPLFMNVTVRNNGSQPARKVPVQVRTHFYDPATIAASDPGAASSRVDEPPTILIDEIAPGESVSRRAQIFFPGRGPQVVEAFLADDAVSADNRRWSVVDMPEGEPVLVIDGSVEQRHAYFLTAAFEPGQRTNTGIRPKVEREDFLRDTTPEVLGAYRAIYLLDVPRLDNRAVQNLESYVRGGGGLAIFVGENVNQTFYATRLFRDGQGLLPLPFERDAFLAPELLENAPDIQVTDHPVFSVFAGERNPFINLVSVEHYLKPPLDWEPTPDSPVQILARLRNGDPLAVERQFGEGAVIAFTTTLAPQWNNWAGDPSFVVAMLKMQAYLASRGYEDESRLVGTPLELRLATKRYRKDVTFVMPPSTESDSSSVVDRTAVGDDEESPFVVAALGAPMGLPSEVSRSGIYEAWSSTVDGALEVQRYALNVDPSEGNLSSPSSQTLLERLDPLPIEYRTADQYTYDFAGAAGYNRSLLLMALLIALLLGEQLLAYFTSYHPARGVTA